MAVEMSKEEKQNMMRHSMAHVMAKAIYKLYPNTKFAIGPSVDDGFYYDIDLDKSLTEEDFDAISKKMDEIIKNDEPFIKKEVSKEEALKLFENQPYKIELINELPQGEIISVYYLGDDWYDLCRGPHVESTKYLRSFAYKFHRISGAYWRGNEKNKMLQRIYCYGFADKNDLKDCIRIAEEAVKRDHRKLGKDLGLFFFSEYAPGMPFYEPKGMLLKNELINYWRQVHKEAGYYEIETPIAMNRKLWEISGHWDHYKQNMYTFKVEDEDFAIKPMNCPGCMLYYKENLHSYKELPLRVAELGKVHRHEASGTLHGLFRVRYFTQDDAHIFMMPSQVASEVKNILDLVDKMYGVFNLTYHLELSTMPENHIGDLADWKIAEDGLKEALKLVGKDYVINEGDGAFYGPKIDIHIKDAIGRTWQCGTIQYDMQLPKRFHCEYIDQDGERREPIMLHRVVYGSIDRFLGIITENYAGAFPIWIAPVQVKVLNIADSNADYARKVYEKLLENGIRAEFDDRNEKIGKKIREAQLQKIPYMIVVGDKEKEEKLIAVRSRSKGDLGTQKLTDFIKQLKVEIETKKND